MDRRDDSSPRLSLCLQMLPRTRLLAYLQAILASILISIHARQSSEYLMRYWLGKHRSYSQPNVILAAAGVGNTCSGHERCCRLPSASCLLLRFSNSLFEVISFLLSLEGRYRHRENSLHNRLDVVVLAVRVSPTCLRSEGK